MTGSVVNLIDDLSTLIGYCRTTQRHVNQAEYFLTVSDGLKYQNMPSIDYYKIFNFNKIIKKPASDESNTISACFASGTS